MTHACLAAQGTPGHGIRRGRCGGPLDYVLIVRGGGEFDRRRFQLVNQGARPRNPPPPEASGNRSGAAHNLAHIAGLAGAAVVEVKPMRCADSSWRAARFGVGDSDVFPIAQEICIANLTGPAMVTHRRSPAPNSCGQAVAV